MANDDRDQRGAGGPAAADPASDAGAGAADTDLSTLKRERDDYYDRLLRKTAEFDNYRRRVERERREQSEQGVVDLLLELLIVVDDFDRALLTADGSESAGAYRKGVELIHAKLHDLLSKRGVKPFDSLGADFDPNVHQAVVYEESREHREGEVTGELQRGYTIGDKLLRPALVKVAKA